MRTQQRFRNHEDEEEQVLHRKAHVPVSRNRAAPLAQLIIFALASVYLVLFFQSLQGRWFDSRWATDDSLQQSFNFLEALNPGVFHGDIISEMMRNYLSPVHYWLGFWLTKATGDAVMTGHWIMLIQLIVTLFFIFLILKQEGGIILGCFGVTWFLHTRNTIQRFSGGLQRGWAAPLIAVFLYFLINRRHKSVIITLACGWLLHAPTTLMLGACYGLWLLWGLLQVATRKEFIAPLRNFVIALPILGLLAIWGNSKPGNLGEMVSYEQALTMPEFSGINGRFQMVPFPTAWSEIKEVGFQAFNSTLTTGPAFLESYASEIASVFFVLLAWFSVKKGAPAFKADSICFLLAILGSYFAARVFAFNLFVPQRYVQIPMTFFFTVFGAMAAWRLGQMKNFLPALGSSAKSTISCLAVGLLVLSCSGLNLVGDANFNAPSFARGDLWNWVKQELPRDAVIAGYPKHIDGVQLFGERRGFVTYEVAHPFYDKYYQEMKRRLEISFRAHFATDSREFLKILEGEEVTHFIFERKLFYPDILEGLRYHAPFDQLLSDLTKHPPERYFYKRIPREINREKYPFLLYRDDQSVVISVAELRVFVDKRRAS